MRISIKKCSSTKSERRLIEILKRSHIPFKFRQKILDKEADFLIGKTIIEIGDHKQNVVKNKVLMEGGYSLITLSNYFVKHHLIEVEDLVKTICHQHLISQHM